MKKIIVAIVALASLTAMSGTKSMIDFDLGGYNNPGRNPFSPWFNYDKDGGDPDDTTKMTLNLNYAYAVTANVQVRAVFAYQSTAVADSNSKMSIGVGANYNLDTDLTNSTYVGILFASDKVSDSEGVGSYGTDGAATTSIFLQAGKRFNLGSLGMFNWSWNPHLSLQMDSENEDAGDQSDTSLTVNVLNVSAFF